MKDNETFEFEDRTFINPDISVTEQDEFINTLRGLQDEKNAQIATETHNLGTDVEPQYGGLSGSEDYWKAKYQTPQTEAVIANMRAVAQQSALNNALTNYSNMLQNRYSQAYRDYNKRIYERNRENERKANEYYANRNTNRNKASGGNSGSTSSSSKTTTQPTSNNNTQGTVNYQTTTEIDVSNGKIKGLDAIQESMVRKETERIKAAEGLNDAQARAKALKNLGLSKNSSSNSGFLKRTVENVKARVAEAKK